jgi:hypothetical protein
MSAQTGYAQLKYSLCFRPIDVGVVQSCCNHVYRLCVGMLHVGSNTRNCAGGRFRLLSVFKLKVYLRDANYIC